MGRRGFSIFDGKDRALPGPGAYTVGGTIGMAAAPGKAGTTLPSAAAFSMKALRPIREAEHSPGPAAYAPAVGLKLPALGARRSTTAPVGEETGKGAAAGAGKPKTAAPPPLPGPNQYEPRLRCVKRAPPAFSFRVKHTEYELFIQDSAGGQFLF
jgi:hypothetical protein